MTFDLLVRNATLPDGRSGLDIAIRDGRIAAIERAIGSEAARIIDAQGCLVAPPFVDIHFHMDATLSLGIPRLNQSGTLLEGIALWGELKPLLTPEAVAERDSRDAGRDHSPMVKAPDAVEVDTTGLTIEQVVERIAALVPR